MSERIIKITKDEMITLGEFCGGWDGQTEIEIGPFCFVVGEPDDAIHVTTTGFVEMDNS